MASVIPRKKELIPPRFMKESVLRLGTEEKSCSSKENRQQVFVRDMLQNGILRVCFSFFPRNGIPSIFLLCRTAWNRILRVFCSAEWFRTKFREFASIFVPWYRIPSILLLCGMVRNRIPRVFCSSEQPEFRRNKLIVPSIPSSKE
jgi:hypothetical protein